MFFHILRSKMRYLSTYADYLKYFETFFFNEYTTEAFNRRLWIFNHFLEFLTNSNTGVVPEEREAIRRKNGDNK